MRIEVLLPIIVNVVLMITNLFVMYFGRQNSLIRKIIERLTAVETRLKDGDSVTISRIVALETKINPFWRVVEENLVDLLKQPTHLSLDELLDKYKEQHGNLELEDLLSLKKELLLIIDQIKSNKRVGFWSTSESKLIGYVILLGILESKICDKEKVTNVGRESECTPSMI